MYRFTTFALSTTMLWLVLAALLPASTPATAADEQQVSLQGHALAVNSVAYSPDGKLLASGSDDKTVRLWNVASGKEQATLAGHNLAVTAVAFSPDGKTLASASADQTVKLWDVPTGKERATLEGHTVSLNCLAYIPDGKTLASGGAPQDNKQSSEIKLWDVAAAKERSTLAAQIQLRALSFSPDGATLASGSTGTIQFWDVAAGKEKSNAWRGIFGNVNSVAYSPDGQTLASSGGYKNRPSAHMLWNVATGKERASLWSKVGVFGVGSMAYSPDGQTLATWCAGAKRAQLELWNVETLKQRAIHPQEGVKSIAFSPDSKTIALACSDGTILLWDLDATPPWSEAVEGLQCWLQPDKVTWKADEVPSFRLHVRNQGKRDVEIHMAQDACQLEFDGAWLAWSGPVSILSGKWPAGRQYDDFEVRVTLESRWASGNNPLALKPGKHKVRVAYVTLDRKQPVRVVSNAAEIQIETPPPKIE